MLGRRKRAVRRRTHQEAWIGVGFAARHCTIVDFSEGGVKLVVDDPDFLQSPFELRFSRTSKGRPCKIVWRRGREIGASFM